MNLSLIVPKTMGEYRLIEIVKGTDRWDGNHEITPREADPMLNLPFFIGFARRTEMRRKEVVASKGRKVATLSPVDPWPARSLSFDDLDGSGHIVIADASGDPPKCSKALTCP